MKKLIGKLVLLAVLLLVGGVVLFMLSPAKMIRKGITSYGPKVTKTSIEVSEIDLSFFSGRGTIKGLKIGNPEGYRSESAVVIPVATIAIRPTTLFKGKLVIRSIEIESPQITYEAKLGGSNLAQIQENIDEFVGKVKGLTGRSSEQKSTDKKPSGGKKIQVDEIVIRNAKVKIAFTLFGGKGANLILPEIRLTNLGQGEEGVTGPEVLKAVWIAIVKATTEKLAGIAGGAVRVGGSILKGVGDILKRDK